MNIFDDTVAAADIIAQAAAEGWQTDDPIRARDFVEMMARERAVTERRAIRIPSDPARYKVYAEAMGATTPVIDLPESFPTDEPYEPTEADRLWWARESAPRVRFQSARRRYRPISDRDMARVGAVG